MGCLFTARPSLMLAVPEVLQLLEGALDPTSPVGFKHRVLTSLLELLRAEEEGLVTRQRMVGRGICGVWCVCAVGRSRGVVDARSRVLRRRYLTFFLGAVPRHRALHSSGVTW